jgi:hypothetical protein
VDGTAEDWRALDVALRCGFRGLPGGSSLAGLLQRAGRKRRWAPPDCWTAGQDELVKALPPAEAAARTGRSLRAVYSRRHALGLTDGRRR